MSLILSNSEQWLENFDTASAVEKHTLLTSALSQTLSPELIEECGLGSLVVEFCDVLDDNNLIDDALALIEKAKMQNEIYQQEFQYLEILRLQYYLFKNQPELIPSLLTQFVVNPLHDVEQLILFTDILKYYGERQIVLDLATTLHQKLQELNENLYGTKDNFGEIIIIDSIQQAYEQQQRGETPNWESINQIFKLLELDESTLNLLEITENLTPEFEISSTIIQNLPKYFKKQRQTDLRTLSIGFSAEMLTQKNISFITSQEIWQSVIELLESDKVTDFRLKHLDSYFLISAAKLDKYIGQMISGLFADQQSKSVAIVWGILYVYEFLLAQKLISQNIYEQVIEAVTKVKVHQIKFFDDHLWKYSFVHRWLPPNSISTTEFEQEKQLFITSIEKVTPLSTEPETGGIEKILDQMKGALPKDILEEIESELFDEEDD
jgi:hypothetical protein